MKRWVAVIIPLLAVAWIPINRFTGDGNAVNHRFSIGNVTLWGRETIC
jgi:hypothetical protein